MLSTPDGLSVGEERLARETGCRASLGRVRKEPFWKEERGVRRLCRAGDVLYTSEVEVWVAPSVMVQLLRKVCF